MINAENTMISNLQAVPQALTQAKVTLKILRHRYTPQQFSVFRQEKCEDCLTVS